MYYLLTRNDEEKGKWRRNGENMGYLLAHDWTLPHLDSRHTSVLSHSEPEEEVIGWVKIFGLCRQFGFLCHWLAKTEMNGDGAHHIPPFHATYHDVTILETHSFLPSPDWVQLFEIILEE